ncbi:putative amidoligase domain-containing protein [Texcoconibacillus texcoconensis]|uniref:Uncharacterized protein n=1 Tax=Texcoconibacillus texcoconensis TaxID=1095777 RepID=A0A840QL19_9BACI|nr:hypothetical protein [Texcoconibacillus texcoconensis]MBB5171991.1 hypothetical protein [Texcoconibacillus texcoconensis]
MEERLTAAQFSKGTGENNLWQYEIYLDELTIKNLKVKKPYSTFRELISPVQFKEYYLADRMLEMARQIACLVTPSSLYVRLERKGKCIRWLDVQTLPSESEQKNHTPIAMTFGADVEFMIVNRKSGKFVAYPGATYDDGTVGTDRALSRHEHHFYRPIFELRPPPATSGEQLYQSVKREYERLSYRLNRHGYDIDSRPNPFGRWTLGGHFHIGGYWPRKVDIRRLDRYVALPLRILEDSSGDERRKTDGRLSAVRPNAFQGFEYRTLSTWCDKILEAKSLFQWFDACIRKQGIEYLDDTPLKKAELEAFYQEDDKQARAICEKMYENIKRTLPQGSFYDDAKSFFNWVLNKPSND